MTKGTIVDAGGARGGRRGLLLCGAAVLVLHALLLDGLDGALTTPERVSPPAPVAAMQVRAVVPESPALAPLPAPVVVVVAVPAPAAVPPVRAPARPRQVTPAVAAPTVTRLAAAAPQEEEVAEPEAAPIVLAALARSVADGPVRAPDAGPAPTTYATRVPPAATLRYELVRGPFRGNGELRWAPAAGRYDLSLEANVSGLAVLTQRSQGGFDAAGLAPQRFTDRRARRSTQAANFDRGAGKVTFSGPKHTVPLLAGAQDRLSWMVQLAAIAAADPQRRVPGARISVPVVGARGDAGTWLFRCIGAEPVATHTGTGPIAALRYVREPEGEHDTAVEVWLAPAYSHLPVRATIRNGSDGDAFELRLREARIGG